LKFWGEKFFPYKKRQKFALKKFLAMKKDEKICLKKFLGDLFFPKNFSQIFALISLASHPRPITPPL